ncbi:UbiA prenyltransferase family-domain-containing protein [Sphaerosporella brunnea]|uniref:Protoheme IX farnesyltransferase, mitochondrial n=1 Tax=Sphaerosporella brunnea TaxID=1250544 RepID=A0A5J5EPA5_9PEZI|nr:UbiA prenyltransferase family-domain-containing protein [Sphaerosporella brunnea]
MLLHRTIASRLATSPPARFNTTNRVCYQCLNTLSRTSPEHRNFSSTFSKLQTLAAAPETWRKPQHYFLSNRFLSKRGRSSVVDIVPPVSALPPHRRRRKEKAEAAADNTAIPPDASSLLSTSSAAQKSALHRDALAYLSLAKPRLTALIVLTTMASYALFPVDPLLSSPAAPTLSALTLVYLTAGTALCCSSANALNMAYEPNFDRLMSRTRNRPLVRGLLSTSQAVGFAGLTGAAGIAALHLGVNPTVAALGALNIFIYAGVYTPMKRVSVANTWVGAIVGGIPPLMGWAAASGAVALDGTFMELLSHPGGWLLAALLFAWQFPHFNALSWPIREEYRNAGYQMAAWKYPALNARVALRYSLLFFPICVGLWYYGVTDVGFLVDSSVLNAWLVREAWKFYQKGGEGGRARSLFWASVWQLPLLLVLAMAHKAGLWRGVYEKFLGVGQEEEESWEEEEEEGEEVTKVQEEAQTVTHR